MIMRNRIARNFFLLFVFLFFSYRPTLGMPNLKNGIHREYHTNGLVRLETRYKNAVLIRKRTFFENGRLLSEIKYKNNRSYKIRNFYENGKLKSIWTKKSGITKYYFEDGKLRLIVDHNEKKQSFRSSYIFSGE